MSDLVKRLREDAAYLRDEYIPAYESIPDAMPHTMDEAAAELQRLQAIVDKLPRTADGVPVTPLMELWHPEAPQMSFTALGVSTVNANTPLGGGDYIDHRVCYSTPEAAEAASGEA